MTPNVTLQPTPFQIMQMREEVKPKVKRKNWDLLTDERIVKCFQQTEAKKRNVTVLTATAGNATGRKSLDTATQATIEEWTKEASDAVIGEEPPQGLLASIIASIIVAIIRRIIERRLGV